MSFKSPLKARRVAVSLATTLQHFQLSLTHLPLSNFSGQVDQWPVPGPSWALGLLQEEGWWLKRQRLTFGEAFLHCLGCTLPLLLPSNHCALKWFLKIQIWSCYTQTPTGLHSLAWPGPCARLLFHHLPSAPAIQTQFLPSAVLPPIDGLCTALLSSSSCLCPTPVPHLDCSSVATSSGKPSPTLRTSSFPCFLLSATEHLTFVLPSDYKLYKGRKGFSSAFIFFACLYIQYIGTMSALGCSITVCWMNKKHIVRTVTKILQTWCLPFLGFPGIFDILYKKKMPFLGSRGKQILFVLWAEL